MIHAANRTIALQLRLIRASYCLEVVGILETGSTAELKTIPFISETGEKKTNNVWRDACLIRKKGAEQVSWVKSSLFFGFPCVYKEAYGHCTKDSNTEQPSMEIDLS